MLISTELLGSIELTTPVCLAPAAPDVALTMNDSCSHIILIRSFHQRRFYQSGSDLVDVISFILTWEVVNR